MWLRLQCNDNKRKYVNNLSVRLLLSARRYTNLCLCKGIFIHPAIEKGLRRMEFFFYSYVEWSYGQEICYNYTVFDHNHRTSKNTSDLFLEKAYENRYYNNLGF